MDRRDTAMYDAVLGGESLAATVMPFPDALALLVERAQGPRGTGRPTQKVADALGVPRRTLRRWLSGESQPNAARRAIVQRAAARMADRSSLSQRRRNAVQRARSITITCEVIVSEEPEDRSITFSLGKGDPFVRLAGDPFGTVLNRFLEGSHDLFAPVAAAMVDDWYRDMFQSTDPDNCIAVRDVRLR